MTDPATGHGPDEVTDVDDAFVDPVVDVPAAPDTHSELAPSPVEPTGHVRIDRVLERLQRLDEREITDHPEEYDAIHRVLRETLAGAGQDEDPAGSA